MVARFKLLGTVAAMALCTGCVHFPYGQSLNRHNFVSTPQMPVTLQLLDTMTGETVWELEVPINKMAVVDLDHDARWTAAQTPHMPATEIRWGIFEPSQRVGMLNEKKPLSGNPVLLKYVIRERGETYEPAGEAARRERQELWRSARFWESSERIEAPSSARPQNQPAPQ